MDLFIHRHLRRKVDADLQVRKSLFRSAASVVVRRRAADVSNATKLCQPFREGTVPEHGPKGRLWTRSSAFGTKGPSASRMADCLERASRGAFPGVAEGSGSLLPRSHDADPAEVVMARRSGSRTPGEWCRSRAGPPRAQAPISFWSFSLYFWLLTAFASMMCVFLNISGVGKIRWLFATAGSSFRSTAFAPWTGQM